MEILSWILVAFSPENLILALVGTVIGIAVGALPGFTPTMGIAVLIPLTYGLNPTTGLIFLGAIYCGAMYGGSISAILVNTPGTAAAAATSMDGYAMTLKGRSHEALVEAAVASFWGGVLSVVALLFMAPPLARFAFRFGPQEKFMMAMFGLTIIASLSTKAIVKGLIAGLFGLALACVGMDPISGYTRFNFGSTFLVGGISLIPAVIGLFSMSQVLVMIAKNNQAADLSNVAKVGKSGVKFADLVRYPFVYLRSAMIGIVVGIIPGTGGDVASYVSHNIGKFFYKGDEYDSEFGDGAREGVACCESANNAVTGGTLIPTLTLGIPGNATTAILMGGLMIHGLTPGYALFTAQRGIIYPFIFALFIANVMMLLIGLFGAKHFAKLTRTPVNILAACVMSLSIMGSYAIHSSASDVMLMFVFGVIGYVFKIYKYNVVPIVLGLILGPIAEAGFSQAMILNGNSFMRTFGTFFTRPICIVFMLMMAAALIFPFYSERKKKTVKAV